MLESLNRLRLPKMAQGNEQEEARKCKRKKTNKAKEDKLSRSVMKCGAFEMKRKHTNKRAFCACHERPSITRKRHERAFLKVHEL